ncbi:MAG: hypothetical protein WB501_03270 [Nitrososphaeraceae archaeon]
MSISLNVLPCCFVMSSINLSILSVTEINLSDSKPIVRIISNLYDLVLKCFICLVPLPQVICIKSIFAYDAIMGRTIPSYRLAAERERRKWKIFRQELDKSERKIFDEMMSYSRLYNAAAVIACKVVLLHPIFMSIIFEHYDL